MKTAAVIGSNFTLKQLRAVYLLQDLDIYQIEIQLEELENRGIIELLYEDGD